MIELTKRGEYWTDDNNTNDVINRLASALSEKYDKYLKNEK